MAESSDSRCTSRDDADHESVELDRNHRRKPLMGKAMSRVVWCVMMHEIVHDCNRPSNRRRACGASSFRIITGKCIWGDKLRPHARLCAVIDPHKIQHKTGSCSGGKRGLDARRPRGTRKTEPKETEKAYRSEESNTQDEGALQQARRVRR
jgi:hypothetical protein